MIVLKILSYATSIFAYIYFAKFIKDEIADVRANGSWWKYEGK